MVWGRRVLGVLEWVTNDSGWKGQDLPSCITSMTSHLCLEPEKGICVLNHKAHVSVPMSYSGWVHILPYPVNPPPFKDRDHGSHPCPFFFGPWQPCISLYREMFSQPPIRRPRALKCIFKLNDEFSPSHPHSLACDQLHNFKSSWLGLGVWLEAKKEFVLRQHQHKESQL